MTKTNFLACAQSVLAEGANIGHLSGDPDYEGQVEDRERVASMIMDRLKTIPATDLKRIKRLHFDWSK